MHAELVVTHTSPAAGQSAASTRCDSPWSIYLAVIYWHFCGRSERDLGKESSWRQFWERRQCFARLANRVACKTGPPQLLLLRILHDTHSFAVTSTFWLRRYRGLDLLSSLQKCTRHNGKLPNLTSWWGDHFIATLLPIEWSCRWQIASSWLNPNLTFLVVPS